MGRPVRVLIPVDSANPEAWSLAVAYAEAVSAKAPSSVSEYVLLTNTKQQLKNTSLATHVGSAVSKALLANRTVSLPSGKQLRHATEQTLGGSARGAVVIAYYADDKMLEKLDAMVGLAGVIAVPWLSDQIDGWTARWNPVVHGQEAKAPAALITDPVIENALAALTIRVNTSHGVLQNRDKEAADETLRILRAKGHALEPEKLKSWAIREGWNPGAASDLAKIALRVVALKAKPSLAKFHDPHGRHQRWSQ